MLKRNHLVRNRKLEDYLSDGFLEKIEIFLEQ